MLFENTFLKAWHLHSKSVVCRISFLELPSSVLEGQVTTSKWISLVPTKELCSGLACEKCPSRLLCNASDNASKISLSPLRWQVDSNFRTNVISALS